MLIIFKLFIIVSIFINIVLCGKNVIKVSKKDCSRIRAEIAIVMDASTSIGPDNFIKGKQFLSDLIKDFKIGPDSTRIGLVTFATDVNVVFRFDSYNTTTDVQKGILGAEFLEGVTAMGAGLDLANKDILSKARSGLPKVILLMTDGQNNRYPNAVMASKKIKEQDVYIIVIGIGSDINDEELKGISSTGEYYKLSTYNDLSSIIEKIHEKFCNTLVELELQTCEIPGDISIVIDEHGPIPRQFEFIAHLIQRLEIGSDKQRVSIFQNDGEIVPIDKFSTRADYMKFIQEKKYTITRKFDNGLVESGRILTSSRKDVAKSVLYLKAIKSTETEEVKAALALRNQGINVVTIAFTTDANTTALNMMSNTKKTILFVNDEFQMSYVNEVAGQICESLKLIYKECTDTKVDIVFVLDCSSSVGPTNWLKQLGLVNRIIRMLDISSKTTRVATVYFNTDAFVGYKLDKYQHKTDLLKATLNLPYSEGATAIGDALQLANKQFHESARNDSVPVMILMTDGQANFGANPESVAINLRDQGVHIITIGITDSISENQLRRISTLNKYYHIGEFNELDTFSVDEITKESCLATKKKPKKKCNDFEKAAKEEL